ncbi:TetR/AcrR family transcriptional regulator [Methylopila sp. M107]|uniref:TetR/AcrR family transcriptional regulator n=1 Tax=Methylopila sp. M107 TaxID=1101190 RepID=UPI0003734B27|nr:TetR/AcrR family transcriptional regulator [Methylopila sp. M107]
MSTDPSAPSAPARQRLTREERRRQLIETSWKIAQAEGADALTLGRLADAANVAKPVVYDHFGTRNGLLAALYQDYDGQQSVGMAQALAAGPETLADKAKIIAAAYVDCVMAQGEKLFGVAAALEGSAEMAAVKRSCDAAFLAQCKAALDPLADGGVSRTGLLGALGAAEALSHAAAAGDIGADEAKAELAAVFFATAQRPEAGKAG